MVLDRVMNNGSEGTASPGRCSWCVYSHEVGTRQGRESRHKPALTRVMIISLALKNSEPPRHHLPHSRSPLTMTPGPAALEAERDAARAERDAARTERDAAAALCARVARAEVRIGRGKH